MKNNDQWIWIVIAICAILLINFFGFSRMGRYGMRGGFYSNIIGGFGMGFFGWIFMLLIIVALVLLIVWLAGQIKESKKRGVRR